MEQTGLDQTNIQQTLDDDDVPLSEIQSVPIRQIPKADLEIGKVYPAFFHEREEGKSFYMTRNIDAERHEILECNALTDFEGTEKLLYDTEMGYMGMYGGSYVLHYFPTGLCSSI